MIKAGNFPLSWGEKTLLPAVTSGNIIDVSQQHNIGFAVFGQQARAVLKQDKVLFLVTLWCNPDGHRYYTAENFIPKE